MLCVITNHSVSFKQCTWISVQLCGVDIRNQDFCMYIYFCLFNVPFTSFSCLHFKQMNTCSELTILLTSTSNKCIHVKSSQMIYLSIFTEICNISWRNPCTLKMYILTTMKRSCTSVGQGWFVGCLKSQQQASVSQGWICSDNFMCCHTEIQVADLTFYLTQSQYTDTGLTSPSTDPITPGTWQGSHWNANL